MSGPRGRIMPLSFTHCRYPRVMSAMPIALAEQYRNLYPFLEKKTNALLSKHHLKAACVLLVKKMCLQGG